MGAAFNTMTLEGKMTRNEVKAAFAKAQDSDRHHNGHSYSGGFGMASGLDFPPKAFTDENSAYDWIADHSDKWGPALAVPCVTGQRSVWIIGAWCAE